MRNFTLSGLLTAAVILAILSLALGCGEASPAAPTPVPPPAVVEVPFTPQPVVVVPEPFCPYRVADALAASQRNGGLQVTFNVTFAPDGKTYLHRYQVEVRRITGDDKVYEVQVDRLSGPHNARAVVELGPEGAPIAVRVRAWYLDECHGTDGRVNTEWTSWVEVAG